MDPCRLCGKKDLSILLNLGEHPIAHRFLDNQSQDEYVHPVILCFCEDCGLIQIDNPIPADLLYSNYFCLSSWQYQPQIPRIVRLIGEFTGIKKGSTILEVGSNDGRFLNALREEGYQKLIGIEPAHDARLAARKERIETIHSYFNRKSAKEFIKRYGKCDLFISRQMLEHINDLNEFSGAMDTVLSPQGFVIFEIPNFATNLNMLDYALWEEHINYFSLDTLKYFLEKSGIQILHYENIIFGGDSLVIVGKYIGKSLSISSLEYMKTLKSKIIKYRDRWPIFRNLFIEYLREHKKQGNKIAIYGAGARLCSLVNFLSIGSFIEFIVDDRFEKQGKYMPGSKLPILSGDALEKHSIDLCLLAVGYECEDKVIAEHQDFIKRGGSFGSVLPPSSRLPDFWRNLAGVLF